MFDPTVTVATASQLADRIAATHALLRESECEELVLAAAWVDVHYLDTGPDDYRPLIQRARAWGVTGARRWRSTARTSSARYAGRVRWRRGR